MNLGEPVAKGNTAKIYLHENKVYKVFNSQLPSGESLYEATKQSYACLCGLPVPKILDIATMDGNQVIVMEYVKGRSMGDMVFENMELSEHFMNISVDVHRKIHSITPDSLEPMSDKLSRQIEMADIDKRQKAALLKKLETMAFDKRLCHGDFHLFNLMMDNNKVTILDWVDSSAGDIRADVYRTYLLYSQVSTHLANIYLKRYCSRSGLTQDEVLEWAPIIAGARLAENVSTEKPERLLRIVDDYCPI
ncbi:phosphotransferase family protein [Alteribacter keqinensis]|uniref:Aminoglycoside phosphotransferase family protein n=1 Tax=Alteribacter keqinensis TaxID=2483800 RepID=A0A3M7TXK7_9BACI|nr:aminoglycoside phosphotransferase family protein [Alteribacter keqinensis]RNA70009.1 aminoglycoside phosphotransferase family protein [Alteribacter keqinensis]